MVYGFGGGGNRHGLMVGFCSIFLFWDCCDLLGKGFGFIVAVIGFVLWVIVTGQRMGK